jgi:putative hemolysin
VNGALFNVALVFVFILVGAVFVAAEIALVSLRDSQIRALATTGRRGDRVAHLASNPNRFLSAAQIGVTFTALLSAAFGATSFADDLGPVFHDWGLSQGLADVLALLAVTIVISYFSLVLGELTPKRIGLQRAERVALALAPAVDRIATAFRPVVWLLSRSTDAVVRLIGGDPTATRDAISEEELRELVAAHETIGSEERKIVEDVFTAGDRQIREVMIPRTEVEFLEARTPVFKAARIAITNPHSRYPVVDRSHDDVVGFVHVRDLFNPAVSGRSVRVEEIVRPMKFLPATKRVLAALSEMRREGHHLAVVLDEYGGTFGIVTLEDLVEELVGDIRDEYDNARPEVEATASGAREVDGLLNLDDFAEETGVMLPDGPYETVAGYVASALGRVPDVGDTVAVGDYDLTVTELDGRRVARIMVSPRALEPEQAGPTEAGQPAPDMTSPGPGVDVSAGDEAGRTQA